MNTEKSKIEEEALLVLAYMQKRDYKDLSKQIEMAKCDTFKDLSFARLALQIPQDHYEVLTMAFPLLQCTDATQKTLAWKKFMSTDLAIPYKPNNKQRSM